MHLSELIKKQNIALLGRWVEGQSTYRFLIAQWIPNDRITILDKKSAIETPAWVQTILWTHYLDDLSAFDCIRRAPGITRTIIENATGKSTDWLPFISQTEFFLHNYTGKIIGITGTKGKSTLSMLTYLTLQKAGKNVVLAGNIGKPVLDGIDRTKPAEYVVYELSSFMIESVFTDRTGRTIDYAVFNTLYSTHTAEHGGYENYVRSKLLLCNHAEKTLVGYQAAQALMSLFPEQEDILPANHTIYGKRWTRTWKNGMFMRMKEELFSDEGMLLIGEHNRYNVCELTCLCDELDIDFTVLQEILKTFGWLEHRLEFVWFFWWISRYNDAIATTPQATVAALDSFWQEVDTLFYGWILGEYDHSLVAKKINEYGIRNLVLFPDTWDVLLWLLDINTINVFHTRSMEAWVQRAAEHTKKWKVVLLSCWSPSFSVWSGFVEKWTLFKTAVQKI